MRLAGHPCSVVIASFLVVTTLLPIALPPMNASIPASSQSTKQTATLGGGCFWCLEAVFERLRGVSTVVSGYAGGTQPNPTYKEVCAGRSGHAEVVQIQFDPAQISFEDLLGVFWECHDPTTLNRQGNDVGTQYRSVIFYHDDAQKRAAEASQVTAAKRFKDPIVTQLLPFQHFYPAEEYHQDYFRRNPGQGYCAVVIAPKLRKLEQLKVVPTVPPP